MKILRVSAPVEGYFDTFLNVEHIESMSAWEQGDVVGVYSALITTVSGRQYNKKFYDRGERNRYIMSWAGESVPASEED